MEAPTYETGFRTAEPAPTPAAAVPTTAKFSTGVAPRRRKTARRAKAVSSSKEFESILKRKEMKEKLDREMKDLAKKEDAAKKKLDTESRNLTLKTKSVVEEARKASAMFKKKIAQVKKQLSKTKTRRAKTSEGRASTRRATAVAAIRERNQAPFLPARPAEPADVKMGMGRRR